MDDKFEQCAVCEWFCSLAIAFWAACVTRHARGWSWLAGAHCIQVSAGDVELPGSPVLCEVYDVDHVYVSMPRRAVVGRTFELQGIPAVFIVHQ